MKLREGERYEEVVLHDGQHTLGDFLGMSKEEAFSQENIRFLLDQYLGSRTDDGKARLLQESKVGRFLQPVLAQYALAEEDAIRCIEDGTIDRLVSRRRTVSPIQNNLF